MFTTPKKFSGRHLLVGQRGEALAARFLEKQGYRLIQRNFVCVLGEIDIVARESDTLVFVEVKTRSSNAFGSPLFAIDARKQSKITRVAMSYLKQGQMETESCRFDVVSIVGKAPPYQIELIRNAFDMAL